MRLWTPTQDVYTVRKDDRHAISAHKHRAGHPWEANVRRTAKEMLAARKIAGNRHRAAMASLQSLVDPLSVSLDRYADQGAVSATWSDDMTGALIAVQHNDWTRTLHLYAAIHEPSVQRIERLTVQAPGTSVAEILRSCKRLAAAAAVAALYDDWHRDVVIANYMMLSWPKVAA